MRAVSVPRFGGPEVLEIIDAPAPTAHVVKVEAAALNWSDLLARAGNYPKGPTPPFIAGIEGAGIDERGRRVAFLARGAHAELASADEVFELPDEIAFDEGAGFLVSYLTAFHALVSAARVQHGDTVLIHAGAGGLGTAAIQIARELGARVVATASSDEKRKLVAYLGAEARDYDQVKDLRPDIVIDPVGGRVTRDSLRLLPAFGRLVLVGLAAAEPPALDPVALVHRTQCIHGLHLDAILADRGLVARALAVLSPWLGSGRIQVQVGAVARLEDVARAHQALATRATYGKIILTP